MNKILTYDHERVIRACYAEEKDSVKKESEINQALDFMKRDGVKFYKYEDSETGALTGYGIFDVQKNSLKKFNRHD